MEEKVNNIEETEKINLADEFMNSPEFKKFFPDQTIIYRSFEFPKVVVQTILSNDLDHYNNNPHTTEITVIEYNVIVNFVNDPDYVGPLEDASCVKMINSDDPFTLTIRTDLGDSDKKLDDEIEKKYLENFKEVFLKLIQIILENLDEDDIKKLNEDD